jgi:hypothetical protein
LKFVEERNISRPSPIPTNYKKRDIYHTLDKLRQQSNRLWNIINAYIPNPSQHNFTHKLIQTTNILEVHIQLSLSLSDYNTLDFPLSKMDQQLISFYASPEINSKRIKFSSSISTQIYLNKRKSPQPLSLTRNNYFDILQSVDPDDITMTTDMDTETNDRQTSDATSIKHPQAKQYEVVSWTLDSSITEISEDIFSEIQQQKKLSDYAGETEYPSVSYKAPKDTVNTTKKLNQHIRFNLIRH